MKLPVCLYGTPVLRESAHPIDLIDEPVKALANDMLETMHVKSGIGLAAQQVGKTCALCVIHLPVEMDQDEEGTRLHPDQSMPMVLINPVVLESSAKETWDMEEGCLSFPDITGKVQRPWSITLCYRDLENVEHTRIFSGMLARVLQHEIDHLNGVLFVDRMSHVKRLALKGKLRRLRQETESRLTH